MANFRISSKKTTTTTVNPEQEIFTRNVSVVEPRNGDNPGYLCFCDDIVTQDNNLFVPVSRYITLFGRNSDPVKVFAAVQTVEFSYLPAGTELASKKVTGFRTHVDQKSINFPGTEQFQLIAKRESMHDVLNRGIADLDAAIARKRAEVSGDEGF